MELSPLGLVEMTRQNVTDGIRGIMTRVCPCCGGELAVPKGLVFHRKAYRSGRLIAWGIALLLMPLVGLGGLLLFRLAAGPSPQALGLLGNQELIQQRLLPQVDQPWVWRELEQRLAAGKLSQEDVDDAINVLVSHMKATRPAGWNQPFPWQGDFLKKASSAGMISEPVLIDLCDAYFGKKAVLDPTQRIRENAKNIPVVIHYGNTWGQQSGLGVMLLWDVAEIQLDGKPARFRRTLKTDNDWMGDVEHALPAGQHELTADVQCAYVDAAQLVGLNVHQLPTRSWPEARKRWKQVVSVKFRVYDKGEPILQLVSDPARAPDRTGSIRIDRLALQDDHDGRKRIRLSMDFLENLAVPVGFDVALRLAGQEIRLGQIHAARLSGWNINGGQQLEARLDSLDPSVRTADIILSPDPSHLEQYPQVTEIWGETIVLRQVPLERLDLAKEEAD